MTRKRSERLGIVSVIRNIPTSLFNKPTKLEPTYSQENLETAAALWEAVLTIERKDAVEASLLTSQRINRSLSFQLQQTRAQLGSVAFRRFVVSLVDRVEEDWRASHPHSLKFPDSFGVGVSDELSFDWDFIPKWLIENVDWTNAQHPRIK